MKCHKADTDQNYSVVVKADDEECIEFILPSAAKDDPDTIEYFLPISEGQKLSIRVEVHGTMHQGCVDILADGNFVAQRRFQNKGAKHVNYHWTFTTFKRTIGHEDDPSHELILPKVVDGDVHTKTLGGGFWTDSRYNFGVGSLAVIIYSNQRESEPRTTEPSYADQTDFKYRLAGPDGGIPPTHELTFTTTNDNIRRDTQTLHLRNAKGGRPGAKSLVKFMMYYRSRDAIERAGCVAASIDSQAIGARQVILKSVEQRGAMASGQQQHKGPYTSLGSSTLAPTPTQPKKKLMGQRLPPPRISSSIGLSKLDMNADATPPASVIGVGSREPAATTTPLSTVLKKRGPGPPRRIPFTYFSDEESDDDAVAPPSDSTRRAEEQPKAPVVPAMASSNGSVYHCGTSQDSDGKKRKRTSDTAAAESLSLLESLRKRPGAEKK